MASAAMSTVRGALSSVTDHEAYQAGQELGEATYATGQTVLELLTVFDPLLGLAAVVVVFGLLLVYFTDSGGF